MGNPSTPLQQLFSDLPPAPDGKVGWPWTYTPEAETATDWAKPGEVLPTISLITPTWNQAQYIEETLRSVLLQGYPALEYIVMDGASTDDTVAIIERYSPWITYWESTPDKGQSHAINKGLGRATGQVINWLNSDDYYAPGTLLTIGRTFAQNPLAMAVGGHSRLFGDGPDRRSNGTDIHPNLAKTMGWARIDQPETFFRATAVQAMGAVETTLRYCMDRDWWLKYLLHFGQDSFVKIDRLLVNFRLHPASKTQSQAQGFYEERDTIFYHLALAYEQDNLAKQILLLGQVVDRQGYAFNCEAQPDANLIRATLHYYLLGLGLEAYARNDSELTTRIFAQINDSLLAHDDQLLFRKIRLRNKFIPKALLQFARRLRRH